LARVECLFITDLVHLVMEVVKIDQVSKFYTLGTQQVQALHNVSLTVEEGDFLALAGPSGSGKSTLLNLIGCIDIPSSGSVYINGQAVTGYTPDQLADLRAHTIGFIFQSSTHSFNSKRSQNLNGENVFSII
jgi:putative ABC transport system ATP-binding protein